MSWAMYPIDWSDEGGLRVCMVLLLLDVLALFTCIVGHVFTVVFDLWHGFARA